MVRLKAMVLASAFTIVEADPKELVGPILLLASEAGSYITGETLVVDGGFLAR